MVDHKALDEAARDKVKRGEPTTAEERLRAKVLTSEQEALVARYDNVTDEELTKYRREKGLD